jgi:hypothetical protein
MAEVKISSEPSYIKEHLLKQIDNLKTDIQNLINSKKTLVDKDEIKQSIEDKKKKMDQLKILNDKLKDIHKKERMETQKRNELLSITRAIDNIEFGAAKRKNNALAMEKAKLAKAQREEVRNKYLEFQQVEKRYSEKDCKLLPGCLFLHKNVLKNYGLCPYIEFDPENVDVDKLYNERKNWLHSQNDNGSLYFEVYKQIIEKQELVSLQSERTKLESEILTFIKNILTPSQIQLYDSAIEFIKEYTSCNIKTKRLKERFKTTINDLSILYSETGLEIHNYLSTCYDLQIVINIIESKHNLTNFERLQRSVAIEKFTEFIESYKKLLETIDIKTKFTSNCLKNLSNDLYNYLTDKSSFLSKNDIRDFKKNIVIQEGKYFKKWSALTDQERLERIESYCVFYVDKNLIESKLLEKSKRDQYVYDLKNLLNEAFQQKKLLYKHISWNVKRGYIDLIKVLKYTESNTFKLEILTNEKNKLTNENEKSTNEKNNSTKTNESDTTKQTDKTTTTDTVDHKKKKVSTRTIITKESEKIINEELLYFILKRSSNTVTKEDKEEFAERIKTKLRVKKLMVNDKKTIFEKYDEIYNVIKNNNR